MPAPATVLSRYSEPDVTPTEWAGTRSEDAEGSASPTCEVIAGRTSHQLLRCGLARRFGSPPATREQKAVKKRADPHVVLSAGCSQ